MRFGLEFTKNGVHCNVVGRCAPAACLTRLAIVARRLKEKGGLIAAPNSDSTFAASVRPPLAVCVFVCVWSNCATWTVRVVGHVCLSLSYCTEYEYGNGDSYAYPTSQKVGTLNVPTKSSILLLLAPPLCFA